MSNLHDVTGKGRDQEAMVRDAESALRARRGSTYDDGEPPGGDDLRESVAKLQVQMDGVSGRLDSIDRRLDRIEDKIPSKWDMAQVVFYVVGGLMAAAIFGPRLASMIPAAP